eukprot:262809_1
MGYLVILSNISEVLEASHIEELLGFCGEILSTEIDGFGETRTCTVTFSEKDHQQAALLLTGTQLGDRPLVVKDGGFIEPPAGTEPAYQEPQNPSNGVPNTNMADFDMALGSQLGVHAQIAPGFIMNAAPSMALPEGEISENVIAATQKRIEDAVLVARTIYVGNLGAEISEHHLRSFFTTIGQVTFVKMAGNPLQAVRYAFVEFDTPENAQRAMGLSGPSAMIGDRQLKVGPAMNPITKPNVKAPNANQRKVDMAMQKVRDAQERIARRKKSESSRRSSRRSRSRSRDRDRRHRRRSRSRSPRHRHHRRERSPRRRRSPSPRAPSPKPASRNKNRDPHAGLVWDGFQWHPPSVVAMAGKLRAQMGQPS